ncbi:zinc-ribbon domain-containing protein [Corynebacterium silvaticum]|uniref:Zinc-ribbon domain-containing protein n=1 Tax=Corynebacterium silvaticum TaxID=2320431 RepID=A0A7U5K998_9CORY|nr:zinc-ribbon domain-containing protein [Corynebacterium silvaticum]ARU45895.2 zinc-ribbon domain-containing protein [Corynebacterium silvaticum]
MMTCAADGCERTGAFRTRTRPTWCDEHLRALYKEGGLTLLDRFTKPAEYLLTRCNHCGFEGHYRFEYVLERRKHSEQVCRACYWTKWAKGARKHSGNRPVDLHHIQQMAEANGFTYLGPLTEPSLDEDPHGTRCNRCGRVEAQRPGDLGWGCTCSRNTKTASAGTKKTAGANLLKNSDSRYADWWDHDRNPPELWETAKLKSRKEAWWRCPADHSFQRRISDVTGSHSSPCPTCREAAAETRKRRADEAAEDPLSTRLTPEIASQWHPTKNEKFKLSTISPNSRRVVWWCGHEFQATPRERDKYERLRCPECRTILDSLAFHYPEIADEWSSENSLSPWHVRPNTSQLVEPPLWVCRQNPAHTWSAMPAVRVNGSQCPKCRTAGKSMIERLYVEAARAYWGEAQSGPRIHSPAFTNHSSWSVDIRVSLADGRSLVIEYDGAYWHKDKGPVDRIKSIDLLRDGHIVVRLREAPLHSLEIDDPDYHELTVYSGAKDPSRDVQMIAQLTQG